MNAALSRSGTFVLPGAEGWRAAAGVVVALALWEFTARALTGSYLLASPSEVIGYLVANGGLMVRALGVTLSEAALGFVYGNLAAIGLALLAFAAPRIERGIAALALLIFCLPLVATGPILRVLYGPGSGPQITLAALAVYYTTLVPLLVGLRAAPATWLDMVRSYGRGRVTALFRIRMFAALPYLVAGLQIAAPAAFLGAMVGEFTGAERGMGVLAIQAMRSLDVPATWALATIAAAVSMFVYWVIGWLGQRLIAGPPPVILAPPVPRRSDDEPRRLAQTLGYLAVLTVLVLLAWAGLMELFGLDGFFAKRPDDIWAYLVASEGAAEHREILLAALWQTLVFTIPGYFAGLFLGAVAAAGIVLFPSAAAVALPVAVALRAVPIVTTAPLVVLLLGRGAVGMIALIAIMIFFPVFVACLQGLRQVPGHVNDVFDSYAASRRQRLFFAQFPAMLPAFFAAARMSVPAALLAATVVEWLATGTGIGSLMALTASTSDYNMLWSATFLVSLAACFAYAGVSWVERRFLDVYASEQLA